MLLTLEKIITIRNVIRSERSISTPGRSVREKEAYVPTDVTAPVSDPVSVWKEFCIEAGIQHNGRMNRPPAIQKELW